jgi:asparagine synthase (glutamine-hydrolysing)
MTRGDFTVSFNGEIYNYREIRQSLIHKGYKFKSTADTEVIVNAYAEFGIDCFNILKGMFTFVLLDENINKVYLVRDSVGIKPLYIYQNDKSLYANSEIRGLKSFFDVDLAVSKQDIFEFFNTGFLYEPSTGFKHIRKLLPGHYLTLDMFSGQSETAKFSNLSSCIEGVSLHDKIANAIQKQQLADVPVGVFFSGGADSTILASLAKDVNLLFAKYDKDLISDVDYKYSSLISQHLDAKLNTIFIEASASRPTDILKAFYFVADNTEELMSDYTFWSTYRLSKAAREQGYKVMLSGMGGDEVFAGYPRYLVVKYHHFIRLAAPFLRLMNYFKLVPESFGKRFDRLLSYVNESNWAVGYSRLLGYFSTTELMALFHDFNSLSDSYENKLDVIKDAYVGDNDRVKLAQHFDSSGFLAHNLSIADKASMLASIELRVPLLDEHVFVDGMSAKSSDLIVGTSLKTPLKRLLASLIPKKLIDRPKTGFNPPLDGLIQALGISVIIDELASLSTVFDISIVNQIVAIHFSGEKNNTYKIWQLLYFARWLKTNS